MNTLYATDTSWRSRSACRDTEDPDVFFAPDGEHHGKTRDAREYRAKKICGPCPVSGNCLAFALATDERGIWGGLNDDQRRSVKRRGSRVHCIRCGSKTQADLEGGGRACVFCGLSWLL